MLALSVFHALRDAVASVADYRVSPRFDAPATNEAILFAVDEIARRDRSQQAVRPEPLDSAQDRPVEGRTDPVSNK
jgi:xanthine dehydrogenase large subunit